MRNLFSAILILAIFNACKKEEEFYAASYAIFIPNSFTPNGDGINDVFQPIFSYGAPTVLQYDLKVYNVENIEVFSTTDKNAVWTGKNLQGQDYPSGAYYFSLKGQYSTGESFSGTGTLALLRP